MPQFGSNYCICIVPATHAAILLIFDVFFFIAYCSRIHYKLTPDIWEYLYQFFKTTHWSGVALSVDGGIQRVQNLH